MARGSHIAYLGHDDIWARDHLAEVRSVIAANRDADFIISGCALYPPGIDRVRVTGVFQDDDAKYTHFFPPSSLTHTKDALGSIGPWADPMSVDLPVDVELQCRAADAGMTFVSTKKITVHKFTAGNRYLSYLVTESDEQLSMLAQTKAPDYSDYLRGLEARARACGLYMKENLNRKAKRAGQESIDRKNRKKGILLPDLRDLDGPLINQLPKGPFATDWQFASSLKLMLSRSNPNPRMLISVASSSLADCMMVVAHKDPDQLSELQISGPLTTPVRLSRPVGYLDRCQAIARFQLKLNASAHTVLQFHLSPSQVGVPGAAESGIGIGSIALAPAGDDQSADLAAMLLEDQYQFLRQRFQKQVRNVKESNP